MSRSPERRIVSAHVPTTVAERLRAAADAAGRTLSWTIARVLSDWCAAQSARDR
jgi:hypothetical protein